MSTNILNKSLSLLVLGSFLLAGCENSCGGATKSGQHGVNGEVAAVVNGAEISAAKLNALYTRAVAQMNRTQRKTNPDIERKLRNSILRKLIDDEIFKQQAKAKGVEVDRFERVQALEQYKLRMGGPKQFESFLREKNLTEDQMIDTVLSELVRDKVVNKYGLDITVSDEEIKSHYEANTMLYTLPEMVRARHILLKLSDQDPPEKAALVLKKAQQVLQEAQDPKNNFDSLVQKYSEGPSVKNNGDLGFFPRGKMVKEFEDLAFNSPLKKPVGPVKTDFGYHILYIEEKTPSQAAPLEDVKDKVVEFIKRNKRSREAEKILTSLRKSAKIKIYDYSMTEKEYLGEPKDEHVTADNTKK